MASHPLNDDKSDVDHPVELPYRYSPLTAPGNIRLLRLLPDQNDNAPIRCELFEYPLKEPTQQADPYEALSYVWGSANNPRSIYVHSHNASKTFHCRIYATESSNAYCGLMLCALTKTMKKRLMTMIFANASRVIVWLGEEMDGSDQAFEALCKLEKSAFNIDNMTLQCITTLLRRPWFQRVWVIQEVAAARQVTVKYGHCEMDGLALCSGVENLGVRLFGYSDLQTLIPPITYLIRHTNFWPKYVTNEDSIGQPRKTFSLNIIPLGTLIDMYHNRKATIRLDMIYALLGLSSDDLTTVDLRADYTLSWEDILSKVIQLSLPNLTSLIWDWETSEYQPLRTLDITSHDRKELSTQVLSELQGRKDEATRLWNIGLLLNSLGKYDLSNEALQRAFKSYGEVWNSLTGDRVGHKTVSPVFDEALMVLHNLAVEYQNATNHSRSPFDSRTPITWAIKQDHAALVSLFLDRGADMDEKDEERNTVLHIAVEHGHKNLVKLLLDRGAYMINSVNNSWWTPLHIASKNGCEVLVKFLVDRGADIRGHRHSSASPFQVAAEYDHESVVKMLLDRDVNYEEASGKTALMYAAERDQLAVANLLLDRGANLNKTSSSGKSALTLGIRHGHVSIVKLLLDRGADIDYDDNGGEDAFHHAIRAPINATTLVNMLLEHGPTCRVTAGWGCEALKLALKTGEVSPDTATRPRRRNQASRR
ncbi:ankyrin repeat-containing domain protein [Podospora australis]|uniref:Ankyrin repeat-containing domain protein n=1 Tax=Podospora australis TaxID=1536484 RepID=A0AAN6WM59_9PEZI|nr:ankyrin repeat-containing domain protein [Podospora australis]